MNSQLSSNAFLKMAPQTSTDFFNWLTQKQLWFCFNFWKELVEM